MVDLRSRMLPFWTEYEEVWGQPVFLDSRDSFTSNKKIDTVCVCVELILRMSNIPTQENTSVKNVDCVRAFKYLLLNTEFDMEEELVDSLEYNELVDKSYPLSPYLLIEILFFLWYEEIIAESVLHLPLDLAVELIEIAKDHLNILDFDRRLNFLSLLLLNSYKRLNLIAEERAICIISFMTNDSTNKLMTFCQELMGFFFKDKIVKLSEVKGLQKSERIGHIIKEMLKVTRECLKSEESNIELMQQMKSLYEISYDDELWKPVNDYFHSQLEVFHQTFFETLWQQVTMIDESIYNDWAKLEDPSCLMTLQKSIRIDCYRLMDLLKKCKNIITDKGMNILDLMKPLEPDTEIAHSERKLQQMIDLLNSNVKLAVKCSVRPAKWNYQIFKTVIKHVSAMDDEDFENLLDYYIDVMGKNGQEDYKRRVYTILSNTMANQGEKRGYESFILPHILMRNVRSSPEASNMQENTESLMSHNSDFNSPFNRRLVLISMLENPQKFLLIIVKICIGHVKYDRERVTISPNDLAFLAPIMTARRGPSRKTFLFSTLSIITKRDNGLDEEWNPEKWDEFLRVMLEKNIFTIDQFTDSVLIPFFEKDNYDFSGKIMTIMLKTLQRVFPECTNETDFTRLFVALAKTLENLRLNDRSSRHQFNEMVDILLSIRDDMREKIATSKLDFMFVTFKLALSDPIDKYHFHKLRFLNVKPSKELPFNVVYKLYEKRCSSNTAKMKRSLQKKGEEINNFSMLEDYTRHFLSICADSEYEIFVKSMIDCDWRKFNYKNQYEAYDRIVALTVEACAFILEYLKRDDHFSCLLKSLVKSTKSIMGEKGLENVKEIEDTLLRHLPALLKSIEKTYNSSSFEDLLSQINNRDTSESAMENLETLLALIDTFADKSLEKIFSWLCKKSSVRASRFSLACDYVSELMIPKPEMPSLLAMYYLLCTENQNK